MTDNDQGSPAPESDPTPPPLFCSKCGTQASAGSTFCGSCGASLTPPEPSSESTSTAANSEQSGSSKGWIIGLLVIIFLVVVALFVFVANSDGDSAADSDPVETAEVVNEKADEDDLDDSDKASESDGKDNGRAKGDETSDRDDGSESSGDDGQSDAGNWLQDLLDSISEWLSGLFDSVDPGDTAPDTPDADVEQ